MSKIVFRLSSVSKEEADGVRKALENVEVDFYETSAGVWGWSLPAIWVKHNDDFDIARKAIDEFQESYLKEIEELNSSLPQRNYWRIASALILAAIVLYVFNSFWLHHWM